MEKKDIHLDDLSALKSVVCGVEYLYGQSDAGVLPP
jgi:hypothetical protein